MKRIDLTTGRVGQSCGFCSRYIYVSLASLSLHPCSVATLTEKYCPGTSLSVTFHKLAGLTFLLGIFIFIQSSTEIIPNCEACGFTSMVFCKCTENVWSCLWSPFRLIALCPLAPDTGKSCVKHSICASASSPMGVASIRDKQFGFFNWCVLSSFSINKVLPYLNISSGVLALLQGQNWCFVDWQISFSALLGAFGLLKPLL